MDPIRLDEVTSDAEFWSLVEQGWMVGTLLTIQVGPGVTMEISPNLAGTLWMIPPGHPEHPGVAGLLTLLQYLPSNNGPTAIDGQGEGSSIGNGFLDLPWWLLLLVLAGLVTMS